MIIYLAGTYSRPFVIEEAMKIYLAGGNGKMQIIKEQIQKSMKIFIADLTPFGRNTYSDSIINNKPYILESYFYIKNQTEWILKLRPFFKDFLLDSGAFTFMNNKGLKCDWDLYVEQYAEFINKHNIELFFELDIDIIVGLKEVERLRVKLETLTNKKCIPCWHKNRGLEYWKQMCKDYNYVAIGGLVTKEIEKKDYSIFNTLLKIANQNKCNVHALGFTNIGGMKKYKFYSVDSTAWLYGNRGGFLYQFNGETLDKIHPKGLRLKGREGAIHNFNEWIKFSKYAEENL